MLEDYPREIVTKDGAPLTLRPVRKDDERRLQEFFAGIPGEERWFLRENMGDPGVLREWIEDLDFERVLPMVEVIAERPSSNRVTAV